jgi:hypothetical protein
MIPDDVAGEPAQSGLSGAGVPFDERHVEVRLDEPASRTFAQVLKSGVHGTCCCRLTSSASAGSSLVAAVTFPPLYFTASPTRSEGAQAPLLTLSEAC